MPVFFAATADTTLRVGTEEITGESRVTLRIVQGKPDTLTLGLAGEGEVVDVTGAGLRDWAVRRAANGQRFLDLRLAVASAPLPASAGTTPAPTINLTIRTRLAKPPVPGKVTPLLLAPGDAVGFSARVAVQTDATLEARVTQSDGMMQVGDPANAAQALQYSSTGAGRIELTLARRGATAGEAELTAATLTGRVNEAAGSVDFTLRATLGAKAAGARLRVLTGAAALSETAAGDGWHTELVTASNGMPAYDLVADRVGAVPVTLAFAAVARENGDWRLVNFQMPAGAAVPVRLEGLGDGVEFDRSGRVVPTAAGGGWQGFLPADGAALLAWRHTRKADEGALSFTTTEQTDVRVGAGLLRQASLITFRVLQGKLPGVRLKLEGPGEITGVEGANVTGFGVTPGEGGARMLEVRLSRPFEGEGQLLVRSEAPLGAFPVSAEPVRLTPEGAVRHSGFVRVANSGAARLEVTDIAGMMQLAPEQFPGGAAEAGARQVFVYRFPSAGHAYKVAASQIQPEVGVSQILTYELGETDRVINADLELDVREAPLRDWSLEIPADHTVVGVAGNGVADQQVETVVRDGRRTLKILFAQPVQGRVLLRLRLEKNQAAAAGDWTLPPLVYPGAKTVRGHVGVVATAGWRVAPAEARQLAEVPLSYFPRQTTGLQQAWRLRDPAWSAALRVEALAQSVSADVFHLYTLKEGVVSASVLVNYFVVGAPANEWRIEVPAAAGNLAVTGQNVSPGDWKRDGGTVVVALRQPALGAATLLLTFDLPLGAGGGTVAPGEVRPLGVQGERGFVQVVSPLQVRLTEGRRDGLLKLEPLELPTELRLLTTLPSLAVFQYTARPFALELKTEWYGAGALVDQAVDFATLQTQVARDGQAVTLARFFVKTHGSQPLRLTLPPGAELWAASVNGATVNVRTDGGQTLVPLPAQLNPNVPAEVALRLGQKSAGGGARVRLAAPQLQVPMVVGEWTVTADRDRLLVARGGTAALVAPNLTETGFEWLSGPRAGRARPIALLLSLTLAALLLRSPRGWRPALAVIAAGGAVWLAADQAHFAWTQRQVNLAAATFAATVVPQGTAVTVELDNVPAWRAMVSWWGLAATGVGAGLLSLGLLRKFFGGESRPAQAALGAALAGLGLLAQHGGAAIFYAAVAAAATLGLLLPGLGGAGRNFRAWLADRRGDADENAPPSMPAPGTTALLVLLATGLAVGLPSPVRAADAADTPKAMQSLTQTWKIHDGRLFAEAELTVRARAGDSFLLLNPPAVLTEFTGDGLRVGKVERDGRTAYHVAADKEGTLTARVKFELAVPDFRQGIPLPTGPAAVQNVRVELDESGWEFGSPMAVRVQPLAGGTEKFSGAALALGPVGSPVITVQPKRRDAAAETVKFYAEVANLYLPGPGVVNGRTRVTVKPAQGRVTVLDLDVPEGFTVGDVTNGPVGEWRFDPVRRRLHVAIAPAQTGAFRLDIETQLGTAALPASLTLRPLRVTGAAGEVGMIALGFGGDAQPEGVRATGLSPVNAEDFDPALLPRQRDGRPLAVLQNVFRYGQEGGELALTVAPVAPEVRVATRQVLSLGDDRLVLAADLVVSITRVGLFKLSFPLPDGLEVEALSGPALSHWTEATEGGRRVITLHLNGRTIGDQQFALTLAGAAPPPQAAWAVPRLGLNEATRQTGELLLVPEKGLRLGAAPADRQKVSQLDPRALGNTQPGTLAFRLLEADWTLRVGIEALEPYVTVQALHEVTLREGQTLTRLALRVRVENAAVKQLRVQLPGLSEEQARTVHATGTAVSDFVRVPGVTDTWELRFQRGIAGDTDAQIEFQSQAARAQGQESVAPPVFPGARQVTQFVAVRGGGRLDLEAAGALPRGWQRADWAGVPAFLRDRGDRTVPALCYRVAEPERPLAVGVRRHDIASVLKLRVKQGGLLTLFSPGGAALTAVELRIEVAEKGTLRVRLPEGATLFNTFVNGEGVPVVRDPAGDGGPAHLFYVAPSTEADRTATVRFVYALPAPAGGGVRLLGPQLAVPLENVTWRVVLPPGHTLGGYDDAGGLRLEPGTPGLAPAAYGVQDYQSLVSGRQREEAQKAVQLLQQAGAYLQRGDQQQAGQVLANVSNSLALDAASNEDARTQLRVLRTQQAVVALNTTRQRLTLNNGGNGEAAPARNAQLEQAASANPYLQGKSNFDPTQLDQLLLGNTADENAALRGIAGRLVDQQLAAEPAPGAIDVTLPTRGQLLTFTRTLQVNGDERLALNLRLAPAARANPAWIALVLAAAAALAALVTARRPRAA